MRICFHRVKAGAHLYVMKTDELGRRMVKWPCECVAIWDRGSTHVEVGLSLSLSHRLCCYSVVTVLFRSNVVFGCTHAWLSSNGALGVYRGCSRLGGVATPAFARDSGSHWGSGAY